MNKIKKYTKLAMYSIFILGVLLVSSSFSSLPKPEYKLNIGEFGIFEYEEVNSEITILGLREGIENDDPRVVDMVIPDEINGKPVIKIGNGAFDSKPIRSLTMGNNVKVIGGGSFYEAPIEGTLDLKNVNVVGDGAFGKSWAKSSIVSLVGNNVTELKSRSFNGNKDLTTVSLDKLEIMGDGALRGTNLEELNLPKLTSIGNRALTGNKNLKELSAPELKVASEWSFYDIEAEKITLPKLEIADKSSFYMIKVRDTLELPSLKEAKIDSFQLANIEGGVRVPALEIVNDASFFGAQIGDKIDLSSATDIKYHAFKQSSINRLILSDKVQIEELAFEVKTIHKGIIKIEGDDWSNIIPGDDPIVNGYQFEGWYLEPKSIFTTEETDGGISITGLQSWVKPDHPDVVNMVIPDEMYKEKIVEIAEGAFENNGNISTLKFGENVKTVKNDAFRLAENIREIDFNNVEYIDSRSFQGAKKLTHLDTKNIKKIGDAAFNGSGIKTVEFKDSLIEIEARAFMSSEIEELFTNKVKEIGNSAFYTTPLNKVEFGESLTTIGSSSFDSTKISELDTNNIRFIGKSAFRNTPLNEVKVGAALETIEDGAFESAYDLIGNYENIVRLSGEFNAEDKINRYGPTARGYKFGFNWIAGEIEGLFDLIPTRYYSKYDNKAYIGYKVVRLRSGLSDDPRIVNLVVPDEYYGDPIVEIGDNAIRNRSEIKAITIGNNVKSIGSGALARLSKLETVNWGNSIEVIGEYNLNDTSLLSEFIAPDSLREIGTGFLYYGENITYIDLNNVEILGGEMLSAYETKYVVKGTENLRKIGNLTMRYYSGDYLDLSSLEEIGDRSFTGDIGYLKLNRDAKVDNSFSRSSNANGGRLGYIEVEYTDKDEVDKFGPTINGYKFHQNWYAGALDEDIFAYENVSLTYNGKTYHGAKIVGPKSGIDDKNVNLASLKALPSYTPDGRPVIEIGEKAFSGMKLPLLSNVGDNVLKISESAFEGATISNKLKLPNVIELESKSLYFTIRGQRIIRSIEVEIGESLSIINDKAFSNNNPIVINLVGYFNEDDDKFGPAPVVRGVRLPHKVIANAQYSLDVLEYELEDRDFVIKGFKDWVTPDDPRVKNLTLSNVQFDIERPIENIYKIKIAENAFNNEIGAAIETLNIYKYSTISFSGKVLPDNSQLKILNIMEADDDSVYSNTRLTGVFEFPNLDAKIISKFNRNDTLGKSPYVFNHQFGDKWEAISRDELSEPFRIELQENKKEENIKKEIEDEIVEGEKGGVEEIDIQEGLEENNGVDESEAKSNNLAGDIEDESTETSIHNSGVEGEEIELEFDLKEEIVSEEISDYKKKKITLPLNLIYKRVITILLK